LGRVGEPIDARGTLKRNKKRKREEEEEEEQQQQQQDRWVSRRHRT
jgi:hypothetical protein